MEIDLNNIKGIYISTEILRGKKLTLREIYIFSLIFSLDSENGFKGIDLTNDKLASFFGISKKQMSAILINLEKLGFITIIFSKDIGSQLRIFSGKALININ